VSPSNCFWIAVACFVLTGLSACGKTTPTSPQSQTLTLTGVITDAATHAGIGGARLEALTGLNVGKATTTDGTGTYVLRDLAADSFRLRASAAGYDAAEQVVTVPANPRADFTLSRTGRCGEAPGAANPVISLFSRPFAGFYLMSNYFDHDRPLEFQDTNGYQLNACGERVIAAGRVDGHSGYDWPMPTGTPLQAVADGEVIAAGMDAPFFCPTLGRTVADQLLVEVKHPVVAGEQFSSVYVHLARADVTLGQAVVRGQQVGLSGNTGCSTEPHLHFQVWRFTHTNNGRPVVVDPYGWNGNGSDPWALDPAGAASVWLWRTGEVPPFALR
jgi:murein DD-endopeptidase MepM/ murein hydrolase activator NlpD